MLLTRLKPQIKIKWILLNLIWVQIFLGVHKMQSWFICTFFCNLADDFELVKVNQKEWSNHATDCFHCLVRAQQKSNTNDWEKQNTENLFSTSC